MTPDSPEPQPLDYGATPPWYERIRLKRVARTSSLVLLLGTVAFLSVPWARRAGSMYRQHVCMTYTLPADRVVYCNDPAEAKRLAAAGASYGTPWTHPAAAPGGPAPPGTAYFVTALRGVWGEGQPLPLAYLHQRTNAAGESRLVILYHTVTDAHGAAALRLGAQVATPRTWAPESQVEVRSQRDDVEFYDLPLPQGVPFRLFGGQSDPADASHFTLRYSIGAREGTIDGWLRGRAVELRVKDGPAGPFIEVTGWANLNSGRGRMQPRATGTPPPARAPTR